MQPTDSQNVEKGVTLDAGQTPDDARLARLASGGDRAAAAMLVERYQTPVRLFLRRLTRDAHLADDLTQETLLRLLRYIHRYDPNRPMKTWLFTIARRLWIDRGRALMRRGTTATLAVEPADNAALPDPVADEEQQAILDAAIEQLSETQRSIVLLFYQQQMSVEATAEVMGLPAGTVKSHLHRARAKLRELLEPQQEVFEQ